jgi:hypothetical protein
MHYLKHPVQLFDTLCQWVVDYREVFVLEMMAVTAIGIFSLKYALVAILVAILLDTFYELFK